MQQLVPSRKIINLQDTRVYQEAKAEGREEGRTERQRATVLMLLEQKAIDLAPADRQQIEEL